MDDRDPLLALTRAVEALLRGATAAVTRVREHLEEEDRGQQSRESDPSSTPELRAELRRLIEWGKGHALGPVKEAVRNEVERWEARAAIDPAAARVQEVFRTALEILEGDLPRPPPTPPGPRPRSTTRATRTSDPGALRR